MMAENVVNLEVVRWRKKLDEIEDQIADLAMRPATMANVRALGLLSAVASHYRMNLRGAEDDCRN